MNSNYLIIYKKANGDIIYRVRKYKPMFNIGKTTSMGWLVLDIKRMDKGKTYSNYNYSLKVDRTTAIINITRQIINMKNINQAIILLIMLYILFCKV